MVRTGIACVFLLAATAARAQLDPLSHAPSAAPDPLTSPGVSSGALELIHLEEAFAADVARGGGAAFASWFAEDGLELPNGKAPVADHAAIARMAQWDPKVYHLTWKAEGAQMGPSGDSGFTYGHYEARSRDPHGELVTTEGRYVTFWKKVSGVWKVALDGSANDAPAGDCCSLPKP